MTAMAELPIAITPVIPSVIPDALLGNATATEAKDAADAGLTPVPVKTPWSLSPLQVAAGSAVLLLMLTTAVNTSTLWKNFTGSPQDNSIIYDEETAAIAADQGTVNSGVVLAATTTTQSGAEYIRNCPCTAARLR